jgi:hypothetical protein
LSFRGFIAWVIWVFLLSLDRFSQSHFRFHQLGLELYLLRKPD